MFGTELRLRSLVWHNLKPLGFALRAFALSLGLRFWLILSFSYITHVKAFFLTVGHFLTRQKKCRAFSNPSNNKCRTLSNPQCRPKSNPKCRTNEVSPIFIQQEISIFETSKKGKLRLENCDRGRGLNPWFLCLSYTDNTKSYIFSPSNFSYDVHIP